MVLTQRDGDRTRLKFGDTVIWLTTVEIQGTKVRLGFEAPPEVEIYRECLLPPEDRYHATHGR